MLKRYSQMVVDGVCRVEPDQSRLAEPRQQIHHTTIVQYLVFGSEHPSIFAGCEGSPPQIQYMSFDIQDEYNLLGDDAERSKMRSSIQSS